MCSATYLSLSADLSGKGNAQEMADRYGMRICVDNLGSFVTIVSDTDEGACYYSFTVEQVEKLRQLLADAIANANAS